MIFVDTNYFLRFLLNDNVRQQEEVRKLFHEAAKGKKELFSSTIVFFEIYWVLISFYKKTKQETVEALENVLQLSFVKFQERQILSDSVSLFKKTTFGIEDCYNICYAKSHSVSDFKTFDKKLEREFKKM